MPHIRSEAVNGYLSLELCYPYVITTHMWSYIIKFTNQLLSRSSHISRAQGPSVLGARFVHSTGTECFILAGSASGPGCPRAWVSPVLSGPPVLWPRRFPVPCPHAWLSPALLSAPWVTHTQSPHRMPLLTLRLLLRALWSPLTRTQSPRRTPLLTLPLPLRALWSPLTALLSDAL